MDTAKGIATAVGASTAISASHGQRWPYTWLDCVFPVNMEHPKAASKLA
jgi:hypothetical protein